METAQDSKLPDKGGSAVEVLPLVERIKAFPQLVPTVASSYGRHPSTLRTALKAERNDNPLVQECLHSLTELERWKNGVQQRGEAFRAERPDPRGAHKLKLQGHE